MIKKNAFVFLVGLVWVFTVSAQTDYWSQIDPRLKKAFIQLKPNMTESQVQNWYNGLHITKRTSLSCTTFLFFVNKEQNLFASFIEIDEVENGASVVFKIKGSEESFKNQLVQQGYVGDWGAKGDARWGYRSWKQGSAFHWRSWSAGKVTVHVDLHNPGRVTGDLARDYENGSEHHRLDGWPHNWRKHHTPRNLVKRIPSGCGMGRDGHFTAYRYPLYSQAKSNMDSYAFIDKHPITSPDVVIDKRKCNLN